MIKNKEHLDLDNIVAMDIEYGGGRTVPRVAIVNYYEQCLYYTDFCMRYEDWVETKLTEAQEEDQNVENHENPMAYQNSYKKSPSKDEEVFSDEQLDKMEEIERLEQEELEDEEFERQRDNPEYYEDTVEFQQEQAKMGVGHQTDNSESHGSDQEEELSQPKKRVRFE